MAVDTSLFAADLPAGTYSVGDIVPLGIVSGPAVVRSGRGSAILKRFIVGTVTSQSGSATFWKVSIKNSDWVDDIKSFTTAMYSATMMDERTGCVQSGHDCPLTPNSSWEVYAECIQGGTTTVANSVFALIDIDYPSVSSIESPERLIGIPASIEDKTTSNALQAPGSLTAGNWTVKNVDIFKAGYEYALAKMELISVTSAVGFVALSSAAGMGGLTRIIPINNAVESIRNFVKYASKLVKGPMDIKYMLFNNSGSTATTSNTTLVMDFVKRRM